MIDVSQVIVVEELPHFNMLLVVLQDYIHYPNRQKKRGERVGDGKPNIKFNIVTGPK